MELFRYCPRCGAEVAPGGDGGAWCGACGRGWYPTSHPAVGAGIVRDGRVLVTIRGRDPFRGLCDVPGGFLEPGEHPVAGLRREVREELGVEVVVGEADCLLMDVARYGEGGDYVLALGFRARLEEGEPTAGDDVAGLRWVDGVELEELDFAWPHDRELLRRALEAGGREVGVHDGGVPG